MGFGWDFFFLEGEEVGFVLREGSESVPLAALTSCESCFVEAVVAASAFFSEEDDREDSPFLLFALFLLLEVELDLFRSAANAIASMCAIIC